MKETKNTSLLQHANNLLRHSPEKMQHPKENSAAVIVFQMRTGVSAFRTVMADDGMYFFL
jgi:hypothetical protein